MCHLFGWLRQAGLVSDEKHGRFVVYTLHPGVFAVSPLGVDMTLPWCRLTIPAA